MTMFDELKELKTMLDQQLISRDEHTKLHAEIIRRAMLPLKDSVRQPLDVTGSPFGIPIASAPGEIIFRHPYTGVISRPTSQSSFWLTLVFGAFYLAYKEHWLAAGAGIVAAILTYGLSWFVLPFFAHRLIVDNYRRKGWIEIGNADSAEDDRNARVMQDLMRRGNEAR